MNLSRFTFLAIASLVASQGSISAQTPARLSLQPNAGLSISGDIGAVYTLQSSTNLALTNGWRSESIIKMSAPSQLVADIGPMTNRVCFYRAVGMAPSNLVFISQGTFTLGSPTNEVDRYDDEGPQTAVTISQGFWMGAHTVTQLEYKSVTGTNPSAFTGALDRPVENVSWFSATNYCGLLTQQEKTAGRIPNGWQYRLPTEAEWEYAARAGTTTRFWYGDDPGYTLLANYAWYTADSNDHTRSVAQKPSNPWGLYDMAGNVWEWCLDWYGPYPGGSVVDPKGVTSGANRVLRGGSWADDANLCRTACRILDDPTSAYSNYGFRVVLAPAQ
jgi:formylglycine-generating enzyme required for sulfatase activity